MALMLLGLFLLAQLDGCAVRGSEAVLSRRCGLDRIDWLDSADGCRFFVNGKGVDDGYLICEKLAFFFGDGCFEGGDEVGAWARVGGVLCGWDFDVASHVKFNTISVGSFPRTGRKLLLLESANMSVTYPKSRVEKFQGEEKYGDVYFEPKTVSMAMSGMLLLCCSMLCPCFRAKNKDPSEQTVIDKELNQVDSVSSFERIPGTPLRVPPSPSRFSLSPQLTRQGTIHLNISQVMKATQNFSPVCKLGEGGFGTVYKGILPDGQVVAIKRAKKEYSALRDEFSNEIELLAKIEHRSLVRLLGYIDKGIERIIITEFVPNGTLREHLDGQHGKLLDFSQRLELAIDIAHGLAYLHLYTEKTIIHRDIKSSNILLTETFRAKVSDFGFARFGPGGEQTHIMTGVKGTAGYLDPEYLKTYKLTTKSDVFSFGILLMEILSARRPVDLSKPHEERIMIRWAFDQYSGGNMRGILDPMLEEVVAVDVLGKLLNLAFQCAAPTRVDRPTMKEVGERLWDIRRDYGRSRMQV